MYLPVYCKVDNNAYLDRKQMFKHGIYAYLQN